TQSCILAIGFSVPRFRKVSAESAVFRLLFAVSISQLLGIIIVAKHFRGFPDNYRIKPVYLSQSNQEKSRKETGHLRVEFLSLLQRAARLPRLVNA
ncbi:hypothetical protein ACFL27_16035, partial [candidate division CSSED10-310 bacterium]